VYDIPKKTFKEMITLNSSRIVGIVGILVNSIVWAITSWRLYAHYSGYSCFSKRDNSNYEKGTLVEGWTKKRGIHEGLWMTMLLEVIGYIILLKNKEEKVGFFVLGIIGRSMLEYWTLSAVTVSWILKLSKARAGLSEQKIVFKMYPAVLLICGIVLFILCVRSGVSLFIEHKDVDNLVVYVESFSWGVQGLATFHCSILLKKRLRTIPQWSSIKTRERLVIASNMLCVMLISSLCFFMRAIILFCNLIFDWPEYSILYWICGIWIPTFVPCLLFLYFLRRRDRVMGWIEGISDASLLTSAPPEEAFLSFRNTMNWENEEEEGAAKETEEWNLGFNESVTL